MAGFIHGIGRLSIRVEILSKRTKLTNSAFDALSGGNL